MRRLSGTAADDGDSGVVVLVLFISLLAEAFEMIMCQIMFCNHLIRLLTISLAFFKIMFTFRATSLILATK